MDEDRIVSLLQATYWAYDRSPEQIKKSLKNADCFGVYLEDEEKTVGFGRVISDYATTYYLCDVIIEEKYQKKGMGTALMEYIESRPEYQGLRGILITRDAQALYERFGYTVLNDRVMVKGLNC